jgi:hypothetical protein
LDCGRSNARFSIHYPDISTQDAWFWGRTKPNFKYEFVQERVTGMRFYSCLTGGNWIQKIQGNKR